MEYAEPRVGYNSPKTSSLLTSVFPEGPVVTTTLPASSI